MIEDSIALAKALTRHGVDVIDCSSGGMSRTIVTDTHATYGYQVQYARRIRQEADIKTMAVGLIVHADQAEEILNTSREGLNNSQTPVRWARVSREGPTNS